tara:strand:- start:1833 stop:1988 length:156 start_codon:yes stop_codon:yes gene_type:complete
MSKNEKSTSSLKSIRLKNEVIEKVEEMAKEENRTFTNMVETILMKTPGYNM